MVNSSLAEISPNRVLRILSAQNAIAFGPASAGDEAGVSVFRNFGSLRQFSLQYSTGGALTTTLKDMTEMMRR
jgi:hypothetical protein